jgi:hypothetical protein
MAWDFQQRLGIITATLLRAAPQLTHLCLVILACLLLFTVAMAVGIGPYLEAAAGLGASLQDMFMGILGGSAVDMTTLFPDGMAQSSIQVFNASMLYTVREFLFWMVLVNFFMAVLGSVFMEVKRSASRKPGGSIAHDLQQYVWPEWRSSAARASIRLKQVASGAARRGQGGQRQQLAAYHTRSMAGEQAQQHMAMLTQQRRQLPTVLSASRLLPWLRRAKAEAGTSSSMAGTLEDVLNRQQQQQQQQQQLAPTLSRHLAVGVPVRVPPANLQQQQHLAAARSKQCALDLEALQELLLQLLEQGSGKGKATSSKHLAHAAQLLATVEAGRRWLRQQHAALEAAGAGSSGSPAAASVLQQWPPGAVAAVADGADVAAVAGAMVVAAALLRHLGVQVAGEAVQQAHELLWACHMGPVSSSGDAPAAAGGAVSAKQRQREAAAAALSRLQEEVVMAGQLQQAVWNAVGAMKRWSGAVGKWNLRTTADTNKWLQQNAEALRLLHQQRREQQGHPATGTAAAAEGGGAHAPREDPHLQAGEGEQSATSQQGTATATTSSSSSSGASGEAANQQPAAAAADSLRPSAEELGDDEFGWAPVRVPLDVMLLLVDVPEASALTTAQLVEALAQQPQQAAAGGGSGSTSSSSLWASPLSAAQLAPGVGGMAAGAGGDAMASLSVHRGPARRLQPLLVPGASPAAPAAMSPVTLHLTPVAGGSRLSSVAVAVRGGPHLDSPHDRPPAAE